MNPPTRSRSRTAIRHVADVLLGWLLSWLGAPPLLASITAALLVAWAIGAVS